MVAGGAVRRSVLPARLERLSLVVVLDAVKAAATAAPGQQAREKRLKGRVEIHDEYIDTVEKEQ